jgi:hypothetical protein
VQPDKNFGALIDVEELRYDEGSAEVDEVFRPTTKKGREI